MDSFDVGAPGTLEEVLGIHGVQRWRVPLLVICGGVAVTRGRVPVNLAVDGRRTQLARGDRVTVDDSAPNCSGALLAISRTPGMYRDYAMTGPPFKGDEHIPRLSKLFEAKPQTVLLKPSGGSLKDFVEALKGEPAIIAPVRDLMVGSHALPIGSIAVPLTPGGVADLNFERLDEAEKAGTIKVDPALLQPRPKDANLADMPARFVIRGCGVGTATPFLTKLKQALGGGLEVVAPKFEHAAGSVPSPGAGIYEFLAYEFVLGRPKPLSTYKDVLEAFIKGGFTDYTGAAIPDQTWAKWIPRGSPPPSHTGPGMPALPELKFHSDLARRVITAQAFYSVRSEVFPGGEVLVNAPTEPVTGADRLAALEASLATRSVYQASHPFPYFRRLGYSTLRALLSAYSWSYHYDESTQKLKCRGTTVVYTVHQPIVDANGKLIHNFFPTVPAGPPLETFTDRDTRFFATV